MESFTSHICLEEKDSSNINHNICKECEAYICRQCMNNLIQQFNTSKCCISPNLMSM